MAIELDLIRDEKQHEAMAKMTKKRTRAVGVLSAVVVLTAAACGSTSSSGPSGGGNQSSSCDLSGAQALVAQYKQLPSFAAPGSTIDISSLKGKKVLTIPASSSVPFNDLIDQGMAAIAGAFGIKYTEYRNQGSTAEWVAGINTAIAQKANVLVLSGSPNPLDLQPQLAQARAAGIKVMVTHAIPEGGGVALSPPLASYLPPNVDALVTAPFKKSADLEAAYAVADTKCKADVLSVTSNDILESKAISDEEVAKVKELCPSCKTSVVDVPLTGWATQMQTDVQSAITRDPNLNYVFGIYDAMAQFIVPGVVAAGAKGRVKVATYNGTPFALKYIQDGNVVAMDAGDNIEWNAYANMDQVFRVLLGDAPVVSENTAVRIFDASNVSEAGNPPTANQGYGNAYICGYLQLWSQSCSNPPRLP
jgi:ribose transport system substrate-binding protein